MFGPNDDPFADLIPGASARAPVIYGDPVVKEPKGPETTNLPQGWERGPDGVARPIQGLPSSFTDPKPEKGNTTPGDIDAAAKGRIDAVAKITSAQKLYGLTKTMRRKFAEGPGATDGVGGIRDFFKTQANSAFTQSGTAARGDIKKALGFTGGEMNTAAEAAMNIGAYLPDSWDYDENAIAKIRLIDETAYRAQQEAVMILGGVPDESGNIIPLEIAREKGMLLPPPDVWEKQTTVEQAATDIGDVIRPAESEKSGAPLIIPKNPAKGGNTPSGAARSLSLGLGDVAQGIGSTLGLIANPLNAGVNALAGTNLSTDLGRTFRDAVGAPMPVTNSERFASAINQGGVGALTLGGAAGLGARGVSALGAGEGVVANALSRFAPNPLRDAAAGGVGMGASELTRQAGGSPLLQAGVGIAAGGAAAAASTPGVARSLLSSRPAATAASRPVIRAAVDEGIEIPKVMVSGSRRDAIRAGTLEADPSTAAYAQNSFGRVNEQVGERVAALGQGGRARDAADLGETTRAAAVAIREGDRQSYRAAYQAAEQIDGDPMVDLATMRGRIDRDIARLGALPGQNRDTIAELQRIRADIEQPIPLSAVREMRTNLREGVDSADLTRSSALKRADARALAAVEGANRDIESALSPQALDAWRGADRQFAQAQTYIKDTLRPFLGKDFDQLPAEAIFGRLKSAANQNGRALADLHRRLPPRLSRDIAATFAESMGKAGGDAGEQFSAVRFIADARKLSPSARRTLFGPSGSDSIDNMLRISRRMRDVQSEINRSKTARPVMQKVQAMMVNLVAVAATGGGAWQGGVGGAAMGGAAAVGMVAGAAKLKAVSAQSLMNPRTTRWLESLLTVKTPGEARQAAARLAVLMERDPTIANDLQPYHDVLTHQVTMPLAASEPNGPRRER